MNGPDTVNFWFAWGLCIAMMFAPLVWMLIDAWRGDR